MPGRLMAEHDTSFNKAIAAVQAKKGLVDTTLPRKPNGVIPGLDPVSQPDAHVESEDAPRQNGVSPEPALAAHESLEHASPLVQLPPELAHITANYQPLSRLFERVAQECYSSLEGTIAAAADTRDQPYVNGEASANSLSTVSASGAEKRLHWLNFANANRERFIKLLVILQWSRQVEDVSKIIDLFAWMNQQENLYNYADDTMGNLKRELHPEKIPSPDLETALEILSTGQSSLMPDLGYLPRDQLSAPKLLKTLRTINTLLHIRLNLHETLPRHFRTFSIDSGRATFTAPAEFEVDLSIADEDPTSQFYFIDFRFLFSPCTEIPAGQLRNQLEGRVTEVLASSGLSGCYDFFHDLVLTYKINILRRQALDLNRSNWAGSLRVEQLHRSLVVQYWSERPGSKHWIEVGVNSGRLADKSLSWKGEQQSRLAVKWMRAAKHAGDIALVQADLVHLDVERVIRGVVAQHTNHTLSSIRSKLITSNCSAEFSSSMELTILLPFLSTVSLSIESITGRMVLNPATAASMHCVDLLNSLQDPAEQSAAILLSYRVFETSDTIRYGAARAGWERLQGVDSKAINWTSAVTKTASNAVRHINVFRPWQKSPWVIVASLTSDAESSWWVAKRNMADSGFGPTAENQLQSLEPIPVRTSAYGITPGLPLTFFTNLERLAVWILSSQVILQTVKQLGIPHAMEELPHKHDITSPTPTILIKASSLLKESRGEASFLRDQVSITLPKTFDELHGKGELPYIVKGSMRDSADLFRLLSKWPSPDTAFADNGVVALRISAGLGSPLVIDQLITRLSSLSRLRRYLDIVKSRNFKCTAAGLDRMTFAYANDTRDSSTKPGVLSAEVTFGQNSVELDFFPAFTNPHAHLRPLFTQLLNPHPSPDANPNALIPAFSIFTRGLTTSLPVLCAFEALQGAATVHLRSLWIYQLVYKRPRCAFTVQYHAHHAQYRPSPLPRMWFIEEVPPPLSAPKNEQLRKALAAFWAAEDGDGEEGGVVVGLRSGVACDLKAVERVLVRLDDVVRACEGGEGSTEVLVTGDAGDGIDGAAGTEEQQGAVEVGLGLSLGPPVAAAAVAAASPAVDRARPQKAVNHEVITLD